MAQAAYDEEVEPQREGKPLDWRKRMSDHIAYALMVYTALQIFVTVETMQSPGTSIAPYIALAILVALVIPACKTYESCWMKMSDEQAADPSYESRYRKSVIGLWMLAIGLPLVLAGLFKALDTLT
jgi:mannose/fructose/N-acetylgalactosamine-specific phosphotransferase system component IIC